MFSPSLGKRTPSSACAWRPRTWARSSANKAAPRVQCEPDRSAASLDDNADTRAAARAAGVPLIDLTGADLAQTRMVMWSPGIAHTHPRVHPVAARARAAGVPIIGDIELLALACPEARFVGITGTNGKSTTTALIGHLLEAAGCKVAVGGNLGIPALDLPAARRRRRLRARDVAPTSSNC